MGQIEKVRALLKLGSEDTEEGRTAAHQAARLIGKHGFQVIESAEIAPVPASPPVPAPPSPFGGPTTRSERDAAASNWVDRMRAGVQDFVGEGLRQAGIELPVVVYVKRRTICKGCGRIIMPQQRMMKHRMLGLRCVPCSQRFV